MHPREHAIISGVAGFLAAVTLQVPPASVLLWTVIAAVVGVFIDVDHVPIAALVNGRYREVWRWMRRPWAALRAPQAFLDDVDPDEDIVLHRLMSHVLLFAALILFWPLHLLLFPAMVGVGAHVVADVYWDRRRGHY